ncbi:MAG: Hsp20/alpha crystallin family protein [Candidatus Hydrothermarchaeota archaeon]|jgi:HSP20 family protein|nr:Hsp20/alpha crystallin family protein [Candidatus Hydrothermarchaeota archaeon]
MSWNIYDEIRRMEEMMERLFGDFEGGISSALLTEGSGGLVPYSERYREPYADLQETDKEVIVTAEIPGVTKGDINISLTDNGIEISADAKHEAKKEKEDVLHSGRFYSKFYKFLSLQSKVHADKAKATYKNGVLEVKLPKAETEKKNTIKVE